MQLQSTRSESDRDFVRERGHDLSMVQEDANGRGNVRHPIVRPTGVGAHFVARESSKMRGTRCLAAAFAGREASS